MTSDKDPRLMMQGLLHLFYDEQPLILKHKDAMDVCFEVIGVNKINPEKTIYDQEAFILAGLWINMGFIESWPIRDNADLIHVTDETVKEGELRIVPADLSNWRWCIQPYKECLRNAEWGEL